MIKYLIVKRVVRYNKRQLALCATGLPLFANYFIFKIFALFLSSKISFEKF